VKEEGMDGAALNPPQAAPSPTTLQPTQPPGTAEASVTMTEVQEGTNTKMSEESTSPPKEDWEMERDHAKQQGDQAFRMGGYRTAIDHYSHAIQLDPEFTVAYSNRSAAYLKNNEKSKALRDAEKVTELDPTLQKGWSRLAAAYHALKRWYNAFESYQKVLEMDSNNAVAKKGLEECQIELDKAEALRKQFEDEEEIERRKEEAEKEKEEEVVEEVPPETSKAADDVEEEEEDDLLNGFFDEVEEVTTKKKEQVEEPSKDVVVVVATNKVKNEKVALGTAKEQMDRLLQTNYEWRNLNPYYVLQLPHVSLKRIFNVWA